MISHGILRPNCAKFVFFGQHQEIKQQSRMSNISRLFRHFPQNVAGKKDGHGKSRNSHGKVMGTIFWQVCGNPEEAPFGESQTQKRGGKSCAQKRNISGPDFHLDFPKSWIRPASRHFKLIQILTNVIDKSHIHGYKQMKS